MSRVIGQVPPLGDVEAGILLAAEQRQHDVGFWNTKVVDGEVVDVGVQVITLVELEAILRRSAALRGQMPPPDFVATTGSCPRCKEVQS